MTSIRGTDSAVEEARLHLGLQDIYDMVSDPMFYPARPPAHWLSALRSPAGCSWFRSHRRVLVTALQY